MNTDTPLPSTDADFVPTPDGSTIPVPRPTPWSLDSDAWRAYFDSLGESRFRAQQVFDWLYRRRVGSPDAMTNLSQSLRGRLQKDFAWKTLHRVESQDAADGSTKILWSTRRGQRIESVILRYPERTSLCVSTQVGCRMACGFCQTGKLGFMRDLDGGEILEQFVQAQELLNAEGRRISHVVMMGMGEPLDNYDAVVFAANRWTDPKYFGLSHRHVTISTSGIVPKIERLATDCRAALAVSLHAARDDLRTRLMPINRRFNLAQLKKALMFYQRTTGQIVTFEYILIRDVNSSVQHARDLVGYIHGLRAKVNLIPYNHHPGLEYSAPSAQTIRDFQAYLSERSIPAPVRYSRGLEMSAACGQLAAKTVADVAARPLRSRMRPAAGVLAT